MVPRVRIPPSPLLNEADGRCQEVIEAADAKQDTLPGTGRSSTPVEPPSLSGADTSTTGGEPRSDKRDDKPDDKLPPTDPDLAAVIEAWPRLPKAVRAGLVAMVRAATGQEGRP